MLEMGEKRGYEYEKLSKNEILRDIIIQDYKNQIPGYEHKNNSYSQNGEDLILNRVLEQHPIGRYIDVGAYHPFQYSNTASLYLNGWRGINIDANPYSIDLLNKYRKDDINLYLSISDKSELRTYYEFKESALNTTNNDRKEFLEETGRIPLNESNLNTTEAKFLLELLYEEDTYIFNLDVEGSDLAILNSLDYDLFSPCFILCESEGQPENIPLLRNYFLISHAVNTFIYRSFACKNGEHSNSTIKKQSEHKCNKQT